MATARANRARRANVWGVSEESTGSPGESQSSDPAQRSQRPAGDGRDPRAKEPALERLQTASDEVLAVFEQNLREDATAAGASEQEIREAQSERPEHP